MNSRAIYLLPFISALMWGFAFILIVWCLQSMAPWWLMTYRCSLATLTYLLFFFFFKKVPTKLEWKWGTIIGISFAGTLGFQAVGLTTTSITNSSFLTVLYVVFTPLLGMLFFKMKMRYSDWWMAAIALFGAYLLSGANLTTIKPGDIWTIACAIIAALHLLLIAISPRSLNPHHLNAIQMFITMLFSGIISFSLNEPHPILLPHLSMISILTLGIVVSIVSFTLQFISMRYIPPGPAAIIFLLESPFASLFAILLLGEKLTPIQSAGAAVIFLSSIVATYFHIRQPIAPKVIETPSLLDTTQPTG